MKYKLENVLYTKLKTDPLPQLVKHEQSHQGMSFNLKKQHTNLVFPRINGLPKQGDERNRPRGNVTIASNSGDLRCVSAPSLSPFLNVWRIIYNSQLLINKSTGIWPVGRSSSLSESTSGKNTLKTQRRKMFTKLLNNSDSHLPCATPMQWHPSGLTWVLAT